MLEKQKRDWDKLGLNDLDEARKRESLSTAKLKGSKVRNWKNSGKLTIKSRLD